MATIPQETRAEVARRRLSELAASFDAQAPDPDRPEPGHRRKPHRSGLRAIHLRLVAVVAVVAVVLLAAWLLAGRPHEVDPAVSAIAATGPADAVSTSPGKAELIVDVAGRVRRPGIVTLPPGSRVHEAIKAAGGPVGDVDTSGLNLARVLADGEQVLVGDPPAGQGGSGDAGGRVNLNSADLVALDALPGVGPVTAESIVSWRQENGPFQSIDDLLEVKGIGDATLAELRDRVTI